MNIDRKIESKKKKMKDMQYKRDNIKNGMNDGGTAGQREAITNLENKMREIQSEIQDLESKKEQDHDRRYGSTFAHKIQIESAEEKMTTSERERRNKLKSQDEPVTEEQARADQRRVDRANRRLR